MPSTSKPRTEYLAKVTKTSGGETFHSAWFGHYRSRETAIAAVRRAYPKGEVTVITAGEFYTRPAKERKKGK